MFEFLILVVVAVISYHIGKIVMSYQLRHLIHKEARRLGLDKSDDINVFEEADPKVSQLVIEETNDTLYLYDRNHSFICQGKTIDELAKLAKQYKNIKYAAVLHDEYTYGFVDGTVKTYAEIVK
jgi:hypothetical protein